MSINWDNSNYKCVFNVVAEKGDKDNIYISPEVKKYDWLFHITTFDTLKIIIQNMTLRATSLCNDNLNDQQEKQRKGVEEFAKGRYVICFSHKTSESKKLWKEYSKDNYDNSVRLCFKNFANYLKNVIFIDYGYADNKEIPTKIYFSNKFKNNEQSVFQNLISNISVFDIKYRDKDSKEIQKNNSYETDISINGSNFLMNVCESLNLGKFKENKWKNEEETRIIIILNNQQYNTPDYVYLRLKDEMFKDLVIMTSPGAREGLKDDVKELISNSKLSSEVKKTITIKESSLVDK